MTALIERIYSWSVTIALVAMSVSFLLVFVRLLRAPSLPDRVVALDMIAYVAVGFIAVYTLVTGEGAFLDAATTLALIAFLATLAFARFVERAGSGHGRDS
jgi:multicomponent Na+:H+ antiporter subunit F